MNRIWQISWRALPRRVSICALAIGNLVAPSIGAAPVRIKDSVLVSGVRVSESNQQWRVRGTLRDSSGSAVADIKLSIAAHVTEACTGGAATSSKNGAFCLVLDQPPRGSAVLETQGTDFYPSSRHVIAQVERDAAVGIVIQTAGKTLSLDEPEHKVTIQLDSSTSSESRYEAELAVLENSRSAESGRIIWLARATLSSQSPSTFTLPSAALGLPGPVRLRARVLNGEKILTETAKPVLLSGTCHLSWILPDTAVEPEQGFTLTAHARVGEHEVAAGNFRVELAGVEVGHGTAQNGGTAITIRFARQRMAQVELSLSYLPTSEGYHAGSSLVGQVALSPPSRWPWLAWLALALAAGYWVMRSWRRPVSKAPIMRPTRRPVSGRVEARPEPAQKCWRGRVIDAHTGEPISGARVAIDVPGPRRDPTGCETVSSALGEFVLDGTATRIAEGARLIASAKRYTQLRGAAPEHGTINIYLVTRRRTLLAALQDWSEAVGPPWHAHPRRTPGQVQELATKPPLPQIRSWASSIEQAAYGPEPVNSAQEAALLDATPPLDRSDWQKR